MPRSTKTITFSLSPAIADRVDQVMKQQGRSRSELVRDALLRYIEDMSGGSSSSTGNSVQEHWASALKTYRRWWKSTGRKSVPPEHEGRSGHQWQPISLNGPNHSILLCFSLGSFQSPPSP